MRIFTVVPFTCLLACSGEGSISIDDSAPTGGGGTTCDAPAAVVLGTGETAWEAIADGDGVTMSYGTQGGWHFWTAGQLTSVGPTISVLGKLVVTRNGEVIAGANPTDATTRDLTDPAMGTWDPATCTGSFAGVFTIIDDFTLPPGRSNLDVICNLEGEEIEFSVEVTDLATGTVVTDLHTVRARLDPLTNCTQ